MNIIELEKLRKAIKDFQNVVTHLHSEFSNMVMNADSPSSPKSYIDLAKKKNIKGLIFTEHGTALHWYAKKKLLEENGFKYVHATEGYTCANLEDKNNYHILVYALNKEGFREINQLISWSYQRDGHFYKRPRFTIDELLSCKNVAIATACLAGVFAKNNNQELCEKLLKWGIENKHKFFLEIQPHNNEEQIVYNQRLIDMSKKYDLQLITSNDTHYTDEAMGKARKDKQLSQRIKFSDEDEFDLSLKNAGEWLEDFVKLGFDAETIIKAIRNTNVLYDMVEEFEIDTSFKMPNLYESPNQELTNRVILESKRMHTMCIPCTNEYYKEIEHKVIEELQVISKLNVSSYMLMIADWIKGLKGKDIHVGFGRGSVNGSMIAYILGITEINPIRWGTLFFRFLNPEKISMPD